MQKENKLQKAANYIWLYETLIVLMCVFQWLLILCFTKFNTSSLWDLLEFIADRNPIPTPFNTAPSLVLFGVQKSSSAMIFLGMGFLFARLVNIFFCFFKKRFSYFLVIAISTIDLFLTFSELFVDAFVSPELFLLNIVFVLFNVLICGFEIIFSITCLSIKNREKIEGRLA